MRRGRRPAPDITALSIARQKEFELADELLALCLETYPGGDDADPSEIRRLAVFQREPDALFCLRRAREILLRGGEKDVSGLGDATRRFRAVFEGRKSYVFNKEDVAFMALRNMLSRICSDAAKRTLRVLLSDGTSFHVVPREWKRDVDDAEVRKDGIFFFVRSRLVCVDDVDRVSHYAEVLWSKKGLKGEE